MTGLPSLTVGIDSTCVTIHPSPTGPGCEPKKVGSALSGLNWIAGFVMKTIQNQSKLSMELIDTLIDNIHVYLLTSGTETGS